LESRGFAILDNGTLVALNIVDLSHQGCKVEPERSLEPGTELRFALYGVSGTARAVVRWSRNGKAGLQFVAEPEPQRPHVPRRHERLEVAAQLSLRRSGRRHYQARLFNLTPAGCKVEFIERPKCGELLWVKFDGFDSLEAKVCWVDGFYGGLRFVRPFYPSVFDLLLARLMS
jgi:hypothetical protein